MFHKTTFILALAMLAACSKEATKQTEASAPETNVAPATRAVSEFNHEINNLNNCAKINSLLKNAEDNIAEFKPQADGNADIKKLLDSFEERKTLLAAKQQQLHCAKAAKPHKKQGR